MHLDRAGTEVQLRGYFLVCETFRQQTSHVELTRAEHPLDRSGMTVVPILFVANASPIVHAVRLIVRQSDGLFCSCDSCEQRARAEPTCNTGGSCELL